MEVTAGSAFVFAAPSGLITIEWVFTSDALLPASGSVVVTIVPSGVGLLLLGFGTSALLTFGAQKIEIVSMRSVMACGIKILRIFQIFLMFTSLRYGKRIGRRDE